MKLLIIFTFLFISFSSIANSESLFLNCSLKELGTGRLKPFTESVEVKKDRRSVLKIEGERFSVGSKLFTIGLMSVSIYDKLKNDSRIMYFQTFANLENPEQFILHLDVESDLAVAILDCSLGESKQ